MGPLQTEVDTLSQSEMESVGDSSELPEGVIGFMRDGRRRYDPAFRRQIAALCRESGESVAGIALRYGVNANLVRKWMDQYPPTEVAMLPVSLSTLPQRHEHSDIDMAETSGTLVIELPGGSVRVNGPVDRYQWYPAVIRGILGAGRAQSVL
ncbi:MAG: transposase [Burkholderiaceae bacterium]